MKETFSGAELRAHAERGAPQGFERRRQAPPPPRRPSGWLKYAVALVVAVAAGRYVYLCMNDRLGGPVADEAGAEAEPQPVPAGGEDAGSAAVTAPDKSAALVKAVAYLSPTEAEMSQLFEYVRNSSHVKENALYSGLMGQVQFVFKGDDDTVNAFATVVKAKEDSDEAIPVICVFGGAARFSRIASLAVAAELCGDKGAATRFVSALKPSDCAKLGEDDMLRLVRDSGLGGALADGKVVAQAKSVAAGLMLGILAHESGHQALGHVLKTGSNVNLEISRNQEREADSFASSVIASSPFGEYILAGTLFWHYALAIQAESGVATTHPLSKERFENFVRANSDLAESLGVNLP